MRINKNIKKYIKIKEQAINYEITSEAEMFDGISTIFSTKNITEKEAVYAYFEKDRIEKAFRILKSLLEMDKIRFWLKDRVKAHIY